MRRLDAKSQLSELRATTTKQLLVVVVVRGMEGGREWEEMASSNAVSEEAGCQVSALRAESKPIRGGRQEESLHKLGKHNGNTPKQHKSLVKNS